MREPAGPDFGMAGARGPHPPNFHQSAPDHRRWRKQWTNLEALIPKVRGGRTEWTSRLHAPSIIVELQAGAICDTSCAGFLKAKSS